MQRRSLRWRLSTPLLSHTRLAGEVSDEEGRHLVSSLRFGLLLVGCGFSPHKGLVSGVSRWEERRKLEGWKVADTTGGLCLSDVCARQMRT